LRKEDVIPRYLHSCKYERGETSLEIDAKKEYTHAKWNKVEAIREKEGRERRAHTGGRVESVKKTKRAESAGAEEKRSGVET
jgi:hypothetical protein